MWSFAQYSEVESDGWYARLAPQWCDNGAMSVNEGAGFSLDGVKQHVNAMEVAAPVQAVNEFEEYQKIQRRAEY